ncbi:MAG: dTMP kinase [Methanobacteriota archaeon]|nr:MAG: dTMP kinase [Euryarchaeota archaeon]TMA02578.1 MAG: dTMP kinase [Euryarchaeota archaeon]
MSSILLSGFVTFEGIDGSGKTTVSHLVLEKLRSRGHSLFLTKEPTTGWLGDVVRRGVEEDANAITESFLFLADRSAHIPQIRSHLEKGDLVLCDRYADSTYAYQGARLVGVIPDPIRFLQNASRGWLLSPDLTILLRVSPELGMERIKDRPTKIRFEDLALLRRVAANYDRLARSRRFAVLDGARSADVVSDDAISAIEKRLGRGRT